MVSGFNPRRVPTTSGYIFVEFHARSPVEELIFKHEITIPKKNPVFF